MKIIDINKDKISREEFYYCINECDKTVTIDSKKFCTDSKCMIRKKKNFTRRKNILKDYKWKEIQHVIFNNYSVSSINRQKVFYILLEAFIKTTYDIELVEYLSKLILGRKVRDKNLITKEIYKKNHNEVEKLLFFLSLKILGIERAEKEIKKYIQGGI